MKYTTLCSLCSLSIAIFYLCQTSLPLMSTVLILRDITFNISRLLPNCLFWTFRCAFCQKKIRFQSNFYFLKILGLPFYTLLFGFQFLYFYSSFRLYSLFSKVKGIFGFVPIYLYLSLFLSSLTLVALRQGISLYVLLYLSSNLLIKTI